MGKIILGLAAPHNPNITSEPDKMTSPVKEKVYGAFGRLEKNLREASPDCLLVLTSDHVTNFFYHNAPMFCLAVSDTCTGPAPKELPRLGVRRSTLKVDIRAPQPRQLDGSRIVNRAHFHVFGIPKM